MVADEENGERQEEQEARRLLSYFGLAQKQILRYRFECEKS